MKIILTILLALIGLPVFGAVFPISQRTTNGTGFGVTTFQKVIGTNVSGVFHGDGTGLTNLTGVGGGAGYTNYIDIRWLGAIADGSTDNTVAISNADWHGHQSNLWVFIPSGVFSATNLTTKAPGWFGVGTNSVLKFATAGTGMFINAGTSNTWLRDLRIWGQSTEMFARGTNAAGARIGLYSQVQASPQVERVQIDGFDLAGLRTGGTTTQARRWARYLDNTLFNNFIGITNTPGQGEYAHYRGNIVYSNHLALAIHSANSRVEDNECSENFNGFIWGTATDFRGHMSWMGNTFNHIYGNDAGIIYSNYTGGLFVNNTLLGGEDKITIFNSTNVVLAYNHGIQLLVGSSTTSQKRSDGIQLHDNMWVGGVIDHSGRLKQWNNLDDDGIWIDGSGSPFFAPGGWGFTTPTNMTVRANLLSSFVVTATNGFRVSSNSWTVATPLVAGDNLYISSNGVPHVIWADNAGVLTTNRLVP